MRNEDLMKVVQQFRLEGAVDAITPLGDGLINDTYLATTLFDNSFTNGKSKTRTLNVIVQFNKTFKYSTLLLLGYTGTSVLTIDK